MAASVTRAEFTALTARVAALEAAASPAPPTQAPSASGLTLAAPTVAVSGSTYTITGDATANESMQVAYFQLAVRGPGAKDLALHPGFSFAQGETTALTGTGTGTGSFTTWLAYSKDATTWVDGPKTTFSVAEVSTDPVTTPPQTPDTPLPPPETPPTTPPTPPAGDPRNIGLVGVSKLPFNSLVFRQTRTRMQDFGTRRGRPMDGLLFFTGRQQWKDFDWRGEGQSDMIKDGLLVVTTMPHAPESEGDRMNAKGADNAYRDQQRRLGQTLVQQGFNAPNHVIRVDWEANGNWYKWSANRPGGAPALKQAIINYVDNLREGGCDKIRFDLCWNQGPNQSGAAFEYFPGPQWIDVLGIDQYDMWPPTFDDATWETKQARPPSVRTVAELARANGIQWAWDEGGNTHGGRAQGGDNPKYWELVRKEITRNLDNCAWHVTYDDPGAPASLRHDFASNPNSWSTYRQVFTS